MLRSGTRGIEPADLPNLFFQVEKVPLRVAVVVLQGEARAKGLPEPSEPSCSTLRANARDA